MYTVEQIAGLLELHPRTIRRFIREGKLEAVKVGGEWRIREEDVEKLAGGAVSRQYEKSRRDIDAFLNDPGLPGGDPLRTCSIVDCRLSAQEAAAISQHLIVIMNEDDPHRGEATFKYMYLEEEKKSRFIVWGRPSFVGKLLTEIGKRTGM
ncbi:helix-turn-helix domain-containing protein [Paenibacillus ginsengarvi]|uniref:helix-turn-helix domain-containing protein n=1 Tax=Paenibacillus ginsengarvi TaxID=400777 RepID=UPI001315728C|nr:helix-turn-helix domain-containing protein [Paenibacillus ginsengarvi]